MKKLFVCIALSLVSGLFFAKDYVVEKSKGSVKYEMSSGTLNKIKKGQTLDGLTNITLDKNSTLEILDENGNAIQINGPYKGTLENSFKRDSSLRKPGLVKSNSQKNDKTPSTSSVRTEELREDLEWEDWPEERNVISVSDLVGIDYADNESRYYNVDYVDGITDEEYLNEFCSKSEGREKLVTILIWCNEKPSHEKTTGLSQSQLETYLTGKNISEEDVRNVEDCLNNIEIGGGSIENFSYQIENETYHMFFFFEIVK